MYAFQNQNQYFFQEQQQHFYNLYCQQQAEHQQKRPNPNTKDIILSEPIQDPAPLPETSKKSLSSNKD